MVHKSTSNFVTIAFYSPALTYTLSTRMLLKLALPPAPSAGKLLSYLKKQKTFLKIRSYQSVDMMHRDLYIVNLTHERQ